MEFKEYICGLGLEKYPFDVYTAENEVEFLEKVYVHMENYDSVKEAYNGKRSIIIRGNRGIGKTALLYDLRNDSRKNGITCTIDDFSRLPMKPSTNDYYELIIRNLAKCLFDRLIDEEKRLKKLKKDDRLFLSMLLFQYTSSTTKRELEEKVENIQLSKIKKIVKKNINFIRFLANYGLSTAVNLINDTLRNYYTFLPPVDEGNLKNILPQIDMGVDSDFLGGDTQYEILCRLCAIIKRTGYEEITVFLDKFDEDQRMQNNAATISEFVNSLLTENKILEDMNLQLIISIWEIPFRKIMSQVRTQKHFCPVLSWSERTLQDALNRRLQVFSGAKIKTYEDLFETSCESKNLEQIFLLANKNPRDLWHIMNSIMHAQYENDSTKMRISNEAIVNGLRSFVVGFNFYEYYPKNPKAKANSMDIYSYIKHLLKVKEEKFTKNQLNLLANTGSSTSNYVVGMENIGLIANTGEKNSGGVLYRICDPKVVYAIKNSIDIIRP